MLCVVQHSRVREGSERDECATSQPNIQQSNVKSIDMDASNSTLLARYCPEFWDCRAGLLNVFVVKVRVVAVSVVVVDVSVVDDDVVDEEDDVVDVEDEVVVVVVLGRPTPRTK
eukprot:m.72617 g.72617  ORF g.72617 m.72617 type:complete len:114 (-) comp16112_c0_seq2:611-952(-)